MDSKLCLAGRDAGLESLDEEVVTGLKPFVEMKMEQLKVYDIYCRSYFNELLEILQRVPVL